MATRTEIKVELTGIHLCCQGCVNAVDAALRSVGVVNSRCDMDNGTVALTANDAATVQKALDAIAAAGFYGITDNSQFAIKAVSNVPQDKIKSLIVSGIHNCCGPCCEAIKRAINTVEGVTGDTAQPRATTFVVTGEFEAASLIRALNDAGFSARVKQ